MDRLRDALAAAADAAEHVARRQAHPSGWEPGVAWDGTSGALTAGPVAQRPESWDELVRVWGLDPADVEVVEPVAFRAWDMPVSAADGGGVRRMFYYRAALRRRRPGLDVDELVAAIGRRRKAPPPPPADPGGEAAFVVAVGDLQLGKADGDGSAGTLAARTPGGQGTCGLPFAERAAARCSRSRRYRLTVTGSCARAAGLSRSRLRCW